VQLLNSTARSSPNFWSIARRDAIKRDFHESAQLSLIAESPVRIAVLDDTAQDLTGHPKVWAKGFMFNHLKLKNRAF
jgi:hypothetical protein